MRCACARSAAYSRFALLPMIQSKECVPGTFWQRERGVCLLSSLIGSEGKEDCVVALIDLSSHTG